MDRSREHTAAFTGHRRYDGECDDALRAVVRELYGRGFRVFWSGMALGFDLAAAEAVLALRGELPGLRLCCAVPFPGQADRFPEADRLRYMRILDRADEVATLAPRYEPRCYLRRDEFMVERSGRAAAHNCLRIAKNREEERTKDAPSKTRARARPRSVLGAGRRPFPDFFALRTLLAPPFAAKRW